MLSFLQKIDSLIHELASKLLVIHVFLMIIFSLVSIVGRWLHFSFMWADPFVRHLVFSAAFLGGVLATQSQGHIRIDLIGRIIESKPKLKINLSRFINLVCTIFCFWLVQAAMSYYAIEAEFGTVSFFNIHSKFLVLIIPIGFGVIALRFFFRVFYPNLNFKEQEA